GPALGFELPPAVHAKLHLRSLRAQSAAPSHLCHATARPYKRRERYLVARTPGARTNACSILAMAGAGNSSLRRWKGYEGDHPCWRHGVAAPPHYDGDQQAALADL